MKKFRLIKLFATVAFLAFTLSSLSSPALSAPPIKAKVFGKGLPLQIEDLPPGRAKSRLDSLSPAARQRALKWLQRFSFPEADLEFLQFDDAGGVLYVDVHEVELVDPTEGTSTAGVVGIQPEDTFTLHSRPGAAKIVFIDFDGHILSGTAWNVGMPDPLYARPFDIDGSPYTFGDEELRRIQEIWHRIAEDFAPFDIDVTTEDPGFFGPTTGRILVTHNVDENNAYMPYYNAGGVAYVDVFGTSYYQAYSPALVYYNNLGNGYPTYVAEAASHELGHNLSLSHDGRGAPYYESYYTGHGTGYVSWGPIMGVGYYTNVTQWSMGEYTASNNMEDDLALLGARLDYRPDDHSDDMSGATPLYVGVDGSIVSTNPQTEDYLLPSADNKGIIESRTDVDFFSVDANAGLLNITVQPAWAAFYRDSLRGANLDVSITLFDSTGALVTSSDPVDNTEASFSITVAAGSYYLAISGTGNALSPYPDYGSLGQYFISGSVAIPLSIPDAPSTMTATALAHNYINLSWNDNSNNETGFRLERSVDQNIWIAISSLAANSIDEDDYAVTELTTYFYRIVAFNDDGESVSNVASVTTPIGPPNVATDLTATSVSDTQINISWLDNASNESGYRVERSVDQVYWVQLTSLPINSSSYSDSGLNSSTTYFYRVVAFNGGGDAISNVVGVTTLSLLAPPSMPTSVMVSDGTDGTATVNWVDSSDNETSFEVMYETKHKKRDVWQGAAIAGTTAADVTQLIHASGTGVYRYSVRAVNASGSSAWSAWSEVTVTDASGGNTSEKGGGKCNPRKGPC